MDYQGNWLQRFLQRSILSPLMTQDDKYESASRERRDSLSTLSSYYDGKQKKPLKPTKLGNDFNVITNHMKVIVDRSVSMLVGGGVEFDLPGEGDTKQSELINKIWDANKKDILLHDLVQFGSIYGTPAVKIIPDGKTAKDGTQVARLIALNPFNLSIFTSPDDMDNVLAYVYRWNEGETAWREKTEKQEVGWLITVEKCDESTHGKWAEQSSEVWGHKFSPIVHGKNLPNAGNVYGMSDIEAIIGLQDKYNEARSNVNKILSLQAYAQMYVVNGKFPRVRVNGQDYIDVSPDKAMEVIGENAKVGLLEPSGDMTASENYIGSIRRDIYEAAATVDSESVKDKVGALTNFGLRVLFKNELAKNATKQLLYGDLLLTVNSHLLELAGMDTDPGKVQWGDALPYDELGKAQVLQAEKNMGIISDQTIQMELGLDPKVEAERMAAQPAQDKRSLIEQIMAGRQ